MSDDRRKKVSAADRCAVTPGLINAYWVAALRDHFVDSEQISDPRYRDFTWSDSDIDSKILIEASGNWTPTKAGQRPALIVKTNDFNWKRVGMGDRKDGYGYATDGNVDYAAMVIGSHSIGVISGLLPEAGNLAYEVFLFTGQFCEVHRAALGLSQLVPIGVSTAFKIKESPGTHLFVVSLAYSYTLQWRLRTHQPVLQFATNANGGNPVQI